MNFKKIWSWLRPLFYLFLIALVASGMKGADLYIKIFAVLYIIGASALIVLSIADLIGYTMPYERYTPPEPILVQIHHYFLLRTYGPGGSISTDDIRFTIGTHLNKCNIPFWDIEKLESGGPGALWKINLSPMYGNIEVARTELQESLDGLLMPRDMEFTRRD